MKRKLKRDETVSHLKVSDIDPDEKDKTINVETKAKLIESINFDF